jgi:hypothetical protein
LVACLVLHGLVVAAFLGPAGLAAVVPFLRSPLGCLVGVAETSFALILLAQQVLPL